MKSTEIFNAPPLPKLSRLTGAYFLRVVFQGAGAADRVSFAMVSNFIRLVDQAARAYDGGRNAILSFRETHDTLALGKFEEGCTQFELCLLSVYRAEALANGILTYGSTPHQLLSLFPANKKLFANRVTKSISRARNTISHIERDLLKGRIREGDPIALFP